MAALTKQQQYAAARDAWTKNPVGPQPYYNDPNAPWNKAAAPTAPAPAPAPAPKPTTTPTYPPGPVPPAVGSATAPASERKPYTKEEYDRLTADQKKAWSSGASRASVDGMGKAGANTGPSGNTNTTKAGSGDYNSFGQAWLASGGRTPADLAAFVKAHPEYGAEIFGTKMDKIRIGGRAYDAVLSAGAGGKGASWNYLDPNKTGSGGGSAGSGTAALPTFSYPDFTPPSYDLPSYVDYGAYQPLTNETFRADPGYEFARTEGMRAMQNAASAEGLLRSGGALKDLMAYGTGLADQEYGNVENRHFRDWQAGGENHLTNYLTRANQESQEFNRALSTYGANFGTKATAAGINLDQKNAQFGQQMSLYDIATRNMPRYTPPGNYGYAT